MKISLKIYVVTYSIMTAVTILGGFLLIDYDFKRNIEQARTRAMEENETLYTYVAVTEETVGSGNAQYSLSRMVRQMSNEENIIYIGEFEELKKQISIQSEEELESEAYIYSFIIEDNRTFIEVVSRYKETYIVNDYEITEILQRRDQNYELYRKVIIAASVVIAAILYLFSWYITRPLSKVTKMAEKLTKGEFDTRIDSSYKKMKSYEVEQLGKTLNLLAENTENYIEEIKESARKKEEFMGNFAHEMKTPMTSIIGYADLLRTYELSPEKRREYSNYIYNEGKRVEELALNLLELIVVEKEKITMKPVDMGAFFKQLEAEVRFLEEKYHVKIKFDCQAGEIRGEVSLLFAAVRNLIDNACKASKEGSFVLVQGRNKQEHYEIFVQDQGCGIEENELERIMEPFYMVDKSRSRKLGGAGLGLSLCSKIIDVHEGELKIKSVLKKGTTVTVRLKHQQKGGRINEQII